MSKKISKINLAEPRRAYYNNAHNTCQECGSLLEEEGCAILLGVKSDSDQADFITNSGGSRFCLTCPVVTFDKGNVEEAAKTALSGDRNIKYRIMGIVYLDAIPDEKSHLEIGSDENPMPLVRFLPSLQGGSNEQNRLKIEPINNPIKSHKSPPKLLNHKKISPNEPCFCGSGKKYKKCCRE